MSRSESYRCHGERPLSMNRAYTDIGGFAPQNAIEEVKERADYITRKSGGNGAVREICDLIIWAKTT